MQSTGLSHLSHEAHLWLPLLPGKSWGKERGLTMQVQAGQLSNAPGPLYIFGNIMRSMVESTLGNTCRSYLFSPI